MRCVQTHNGLAYTCIPYKHKNLYRWLITDLTEADHACSTWQPIASIHLHRNYKGTHSNEDVIFKADGLKTPEKFGSTCIIYAAHTFSSLDRCSNHRSLWNLLGSGAKNKLYIATQCST